MKLHDKNKRRLILRKLLLKKLIKNILEGKVVNLPESSVLQNPQGQPRPNYRSPSERSSYNYGYMEIDEIGAGTPTVW